MWEVACPFYIQLYIQACLAHANYTQEIINVGQYRYIVCIEKKFNKLT